MKSTNQYRKQVVIEVVGPIEKGPFSCRKSLGYCGETLPDIYHIVGLTDKDAKYWLCPNCGCHEVVKGTPMNFGEVAPMELHVDPELRRKISSFEPPKHD